MPVVEAEKLTNFVYHILHAAGASETDSRLVADSLVRSNLAGHDSHGVVRVRQYLDTIAAGDLDPAAGPVLAHETGAISMVDAQYGYGQVAARFAMSLTIDKARTHGLAATGLFNSNHVGRLGEWVQLAAEQELIGLAFCNGGRPGGLVTPYGGAGRLLGTNPIAAAVPVAGRSPIVIDFATSIAPEGKVRLALNKQEHVPEGWILDSAGHSSLNPADLYAGGMLLPMAQHKGYGLSLLVEFLGGILTGQGCPGLPDYATLRNGVVFIVLAISAFRPAADFLAEGSALCDQVTATPPAPGFETVLLPGDPEEHAAERRRLDGIAIDETTWSQLTRAAASLGVSLPDGIQGQMP
jgi:uncharacterized oxidoreductase